MNSGTNRHGKQDPPGLDDLRAALDPGGEPEFDHAALVAGVKRRATRLRRRRALAQGVTAVVLVPTLVGAGWMISTRVNDIPDTPAAHTTHTLLEDQTSSTQTPLLEEATATAQATDPPYQDPALLPEAQLEAPNPDWPNAWEVPDARPTGIDLLDQLGEPQLAMQYPRVVPLPGWHAAARDEGIEPHSGAHWSFFDTEQDDGGQVEITITAWTDSRAAMADLLADTTSTLAGWLPGERERLDWLPEGHAQEDSLLLGSTDPGLPDAGALIRQGDYLVGVAVAGPGTDRERAAEVAAQIAERTAANLAHLDPEHGRD